MADMKQGKPVDFLFVHVPKLGNYYKLTDEYTYVNYLPVGVFAICDLLNRNGVQSRIKHLGLETILDGSFSIAQWVKDHRIPVVGMSLHWHFQSYDVIDVAKKIKATSPDTIIVLGGLTASRFASEILECFEQIDAVIRGDADKGVVSFAQTVLTEERDYFWVENCVWRSGSGKIVNNGISFVADAEAISSYDYANLSLLDHHDAYRDYYKMPMFWMNNATFEENLNIRMSSETMFPLALGRGCPMNCSYCGGGRSAHKKLGGREQIAMRSVESVVKTMQSAVEYGYSGFLSSYDPTPNDDRYYLSLLETMRREKVKPGWGLEFWGLPSERLIEAFTRTVDMQRSYIALSPESGSEKVRRRNKGMYYSNDALFKAMDLLEKYNVPTVIYFTIGLVDETAEDINRTVALRTLLKKKWRKIIEGVFCVPIQIEPGSPIFENPEKYGVISTRSTFMDFYDSHSRNDSGPLTYLGYANKAYPDTGDDPKAYEDALQRIRCKNFCIISPKLFGKIELGLLSRALCGLKHSKWKKMGFGHAPIRRRTFK